VAEPANDNEGRKTFHARPCPICRKPSAEKYHPFCSKRCADVDLARWLGGTYAIPAAPEDEGDEEEGPTNPTGRG
jgi:endogenous inhibitor of DNA gyrase (YacG/DUF329 family)